MRSGGAKTGMQLKHSLDGLLQTRAHDLETTGAVAARVDNNRRASLTDFATSLIRGDDRHNRRSSTYASFPPSMRNSRNGQAIRRRFQVIHMTVLHRLMFLAFTLKRNELLTTLSKVISKRSKLAFKEARHPLLTPKKSHNRRSSVINSQHSFQKNQFIV
jgi:hypothetical protein